jgi:hypothetical protein
MKRRCVWPSLSYRSRRQRPFRHSRSGALSSDKRGMTPRAYATPGGEWTRLFFLVDGTKDPVTSLAQRAPTGTSIRHDAFDAPERRSISGRLFTCRQQIPGRRVSAASWMRKRNPRRRAPDRRAWPRAADRRRAGSDGDGVPRYGRRHASWSETARESTGAWAVPMGGSGCGGHQWRWIRVAYANATETHDHPRPSGPHGVGRRAAYPFGAISYREVALATDGIIPSGVGHADCRRQEPCSPMKTIDRHAADVRRWVLPLLSAVWTGAE